MTQRQERFAAIAVFLFGAICLFLTAPHHGEFWWSDSPRHALNGVFVKDLVAAMPSDPKTWAMQYYVKYPALTILFYPPLFYVISAPFYAVFGVSQATALFVVMLHYFALAFGLYVLSRRWTGGIAAIAVGLAAIAVPGMALWGRQVMLEVPSLAFAVWAMVALLRYADTRRPLLLYLSIILLGLAAYTKLNAAFLFPVIAFTVLAGRGTQALSDKHVWLAAVLAVVGMVPLALMTWKFGAANVQSVTGVADLEVSRSSIMGWFWYGIHLPELVWWPLFILGVLAPVLAVARILRPRLSLSDTVFLVSWFLVSYLALSAIDLKETRHALILLPPFLMGAALVLPGIFPARRLGEFAFAVIVIATGLYTLLFAPSPRIEGYREAAEWISAHAPKDAVVVFSGKRDGSFIFNMRTMPRRDISILRSDKILLTVSVRRTLGVKQNLMSEDEIAATLDHDGVSYAVAQDDFWIDLAAMKRFQDVLRSRHFAEVAHFPVKANVPSEDHMIRIYRNLGKVNPNPGPVLLDLAIIGQKVGGKLK